ncbi:hypothetical protein APY04_2703 [Hyphomicrobium sulfonivorans]|uniref:J domain-containing protein n=1 Tax=Hyphomicrobium sulfonivorans TaxID=121290 RepID=A0A109BBT1_HYPSL|nr:hypothetical protein [Hyphomicrobium sulfonivorans]KWT65856.1 hypothetical protein APY04_2703 [Hyphomicrobium sulfonivorans]
MRVFLSRGSRPHSFTEVLESVSRAAGIDLGDSEKGPRSVFRRAAATFNRLSDWQPHQNAAGTHRRANASHHAADTKFDAETMERFASPSYHIHEYLQHQDGRRAASVTPVRSIDPKIVARELRITTRMSVADLTRLRRTFALANHPDRLAVTEREIATRRMMIANELIDDAMKKRSMR